MLKFPKSKAGTSRDTSRTFAPCSKESLPFLKEMSGLPQHTYIKYKCLHLIDFKKLTFNTKDPTFDGDLLEREDRLMQSSRKEISTVSFVLNSFNGLPLQ